MIGESKMNLINFIVWLSTGAVIGWIASRMVKKGEHKTHDKPLAGEDHQQTP
jgi:hypothetical protein